MSDPILKSIGTILKKQQERDAIHVAVLCAKAEEHLVQGTTVKVENGLARHAKRAEAIGIVDPFLTKGVEPGQYFWVHIFPGTVTGMRHHYELPAVDGGKKPEPDAKSVAWLEAYADMTKTDYATLIEKVTEFVNNGCSWATMDNEHNYYEVPDEFWTHFKVVTGLDGSGHFWTCCL